MLNTLEKLHFFQYTSIIELKRKPIAELEKQDIIYKSKSGK